MPRNIFTIFLMLKLYFAFSPCSINKIAIALTYGKMASGRTQ